MTDLIEAFFYGLYMDPDLLISLGFEPRSSRRACLENHELDLHGLAKVAPRMDSEVWGMLIKLPVKHLEKMYSFETTRAYVPGYCDVVTEEGRVCSVRCYNAPPDSAAKFNDEYHEKLLSVARKMDLPENYLSRLESLGK